MVSRRTAVRPVHVRGRRQGSHMGRPAPHQVHKIFIGRTTPEARHLSVEAFAVRGWQGGRRRRQWSPEGVSKTRESFFRAACAAGYERPAAAPDGAPRMHTRCQCAPARLGQRNLRNAYAALRVRP